MRKVIVTFMGVVAVIAATASLASGATGKPHGHAALAKCGTLYTPPCRLPAAVVTSRAACLAAGATVKFPIALSANAGIRKVTVVFRGKTVKSVTYSGQPTKKKLTVGVHTIGLAPGVYSVTVKVTDVRGKSKTSVAHFSVCRPKPIFTG